MSTDDGEGFVARDWGTGDGGNGLSFAATDLYAEPPLSSVLRQLLRHSRRLVGAMAGSVSLVEPGRDQYSKMAEYGAACQLGHTFPLGEGVTGEVVNRRRPVVLASYRDVRTGHLPAAHPASRGPVMAVPIWWLGEVIGANVVFGGTTTGFSPADVDELELLTQVAAPGIARAERAVVSTSAPQHMMKVHGARTAHRTPFTAREAEVLELLGLGMSDPEIGAVLGISRKTVEKHVGAILRKTSSARRTSAVMRALERGWLDGRDQPAHS